MAVDATRRQAALGGILIKHITLIALVIQNAGLVLLLRYSRIMPLVNGERYFPSTAVLLAEVVKFSVFLSIALYETATSPHSSDTSTITELVNALFRAVFSGDSWKLAIPALLYSLQNTLQYVAAGNLDAATFSVAYQLKVASAAIFGVILLGRSLDGRKWMSLVLLAVGVVIVQLGTVSSQEGGPLSMKDLRDGVSFNPPRSIWELRDAGNAAAEQLNKRSATYEGIDEDVAAANPRMNATIGLAAAVLACGISGGAGVYFEKLLKSKDGPRTSIWIRNVQLSFYSLWPVLFLGVLFKDGEHLATRGFFAGYNWIVFLVIILQAAGGILVALTLNYADSASRSATTTASAVVIIVVSALLLEFPKSLLFLLGTLVTLAAAFIYQSTPDEKKMRPPPINVSQYEKNEEASYFDLEAVATAGKSPLRDPLREALSTSRPGTPSGERRLFRAKSSEWKKKREL
ncbi:Putative nucleotide-sugar transporter [Septoria linicola]|uniref:Nucleotide-sugar transporter n=1 Tax=Septoria linicola TaxID=215465 RepID=A0A9Q9ATV7_9PEZI|nr:putative nucleotide-sugar transporter [Septoria linicola]USW52435.1 Putative nucleotide-sugar transporter [Septoria linicola]